MQIIQAYYYFSYLLRVLYLLTPNGKLLVERDLCGHLVLGRQILTDSTGSSLSPHLGHLTQEVRNVKAEEPTFSPGTEGLIRQGGPLRTSWHLKQLFLLLIHYICSQFPHLPLLPSPPDPLLLCFPSKGGREKGRERECEHKSAGVTGFPGNSYQTNKIEKTGTNPHSMAGHDNSVGGKGSHVQAKESEIPLSIVGSSTRTTSYTTIKYMHMT